MNKLTAISSTAMLSVMIAGSIAGTALACHPAGKIVKSVQNITAGGDAKDANSAAAAVSAKPGDILQYTIEISNTAEAGDNDLTSIKLTDTLPAGVALVDSSTVVGGDVANVKPGQSVTKQYKVKVTATTNGAVIENKACYTANNRLNNLPQNGCDVADVKVNVPVVVTPVTPVTPQTPATPVVEETPGTGADTTPVVEAAAPEELPNTGVGTIVPIAGFASALIGFIVSTVLQKRRVQA